MLEKLLHINNWFHVRTLKLGIFNVISGIFGLGSRKFGEMKVEVRLTVIMTSLTSAECDCVYAKKLQVITVLITGSAVALHCCKAHAKLIGKMGNSTPCKIVTPENIILKLCIRD